MPQHPLSDLAALTADGRRRGIASACSAHPLVIEAALRQAATLGKAVLIEATCNQVNQLGGYTGMTPEAFRRSVHGLAAEVGLDPAQVVLGGDHLGPNPWKHLAADDAMRPSEEMVAAYIEAGFVKIHLDTSMACLGDPEILPEPIIVERAARLAAVAEARAGRHGTALRYVIGTEVPIPGGAHEAIDRLAVTGRKQQSTPSERTVKLSRRQGSEVRSNGSSLWLSSLEWNSAPPMSFRMRRNGRPR